MKRCKHCNKNKAESEFRKCSKFEDGLDTWCKVCRRVSDKKTYYNHLETNRKDGRRRKYKARDIARHYVLDYLKTHPCVDCGEHDPVVLEFDHRENKLEAISTLMQDSSIKRIQEEIDKCDIRCANCHRRKTSKELGYFRLNKTL